jgi:hypothetical protein
MHIEYVHIYMCRYICISVHKDLTASVNLQIKNQFTHKNKSELYICIYVYTNIYMYICIYIYIYISALTLEIVLFDNNIQIHDLFFSG